MTASLSMTPVVPVWAEEEVEIENESQAEEITEDGNSGMSDFAEVTDETEELPDIDLEEEETQTNEEVAMEITPEDDQNAETEEDFRDTYAEHDNPESILIDRENVSALENEMEKSLSSLENRVLHLYLEGNSYTEIAEILGKTPKSIDNALRRIRKKIKKYF